MVVSQGAEGPWWETPGFVGSTSTLNISWFVCARGVGYMTTSLNDPTETSLELHDSIRGSLSRR